MCIYLDIPSTYESLTKKLRHTTGRKYDVGCFQNVCLFFQLLDLVCIHSLKKKLLSFSFANFEMTTGSTGMAKLVGYSNEPHCLPVLHLVILKFANEKARSFFFE